MKVFYKSILLIAIILGFGTNIVFSQCMTYAVPFEQRVSKAAYIVQGKVVDKHCYIDAATGMVNTLNRFKVAAWLKNYMPVEDVYVITLGGVYGNRAMQVNPALQLDEYHEYVLMLEANNLQMDDKNFRLQYPQSLQMLTYADAQGSLTNERNYYHDLHYRTPINEQKLFAEISSLTNEPAKKPSGELFAARQPIAAPQSGITAITGFSPTSTASGTIVPANNITISGSGFGAGAGTVFYSNADDGGATFTSSGVATDNVSWADGSIENKPASAAGTGPINVNGAMTSGTNLTITYSHLTINSNFSGFGSTTRQRYYLVNKNGTGGYTFTFNTAFEANTAATNAFKRALISWRCNTGLNFTYNGSSTSGLTTAALDGTNLVTFDGSLPMGVLGRATTYFSGSSFGACTLASTVWWADELDMQFCPDPPLAGFTWQYGTATPSGTQFDFESVALHELGHHHGLGHVINSLGVMHYALTNGSTRRLLYADDIIGGMAKVSYSIAPLCFTPATVLGPMISVPVGSCVLQAGFATFSGERKNVSTNKLNWVTAFEVNNRGFYLQRSADMNNFTDISFTNGAGNSNQALSYEYFDSKAGVYPWYYRLRQVAFDGSEKNSKTIFIPGDQSTTFKAWANEVGDRLFIYRNQTINTDAVLNIFNSLGQSVITKQINTDRDEITVGHLPKGVYTYRLYFDKQKITGKLLLGTR